jgi:hypothetical protein
VNRIILAKCLMVLGHAIQWGMIYLKAKWAREEYAEQKQK